MADSLIAEDRIGGAAPASDRAAYSADEMGLCLSGGGFKAAAYHLGALERLNQLGVLRNIKRIASVSGGSITAAYLGLYWSKLQWDANDSATNFTELIVAPLTRFLTTAKIDVGAALSGIFIPGRSGGDAVESAYRKLLYGDATLQSLPADADGPRFVILATNFEINSLWRFSRPYAADYRVGMVEAPNFQLAKVVAASSGFPPVFCPIEIKFAPGSVKPLDGANRNHAPYNERALLCDGGAYDNMGTEPIWKRYGKLLISNAGDPIDEKPSPPRDWVRMLRRILGMIHRQAENNRVRWFMAMAKNGERKLAYWPLRNYARLYPTHGPALSDADAELAMHEGVRLSALKADAFKRLQRHGYSLADAALRSYLGYPNTPPSALP